MNCINCGAEVTGKYCTQCGQSNPPRRLSLSHLFEDFQASMFGFDGMLLRTVRDVTLHPGKVAKRFVEGNRVTYYKPISYFLIVITIMLLITSLLGIDYIDYLKIASQENVRPGSEKATNAALEWINENLRLFSFIMIPIQAFFARYVFFRKSGYNFIENCVLPFYVWGQLYITTIFSIIYFKLTGQVVSVTLVNVIYFLYFGYAFSDLFTYQSRIKAFFKGLGVYLGIYVFIIVVVSIATIVIAIVSPEMLKELDGSVKY